MTFLSELSSLQAAFLMLAAAAGGGVLFTLLRVMGVQYPAWFGAGHGLLGLAALCVLGAALFQAPDGAGLSRGWWAFGVLVSALLGGLLFFKLLGLKRQPLVLALMHGGLALVGLFLLFPVAFPAVFP